MLRFVWVARPQPCKTNSYLTLYTIRIHHFDYDCWAHRSYDLCIRTKQTECQQVLSGLTVKANNIGHRLFVEMIKRLGFNSCKICSQLYPQIKSNQKHVRCQHRQQITSKQVSGRDRSITTGPLGS